MAAGCANNRFVPRCFKRGIEQDDQIRNSAFPDSGRQFRIGGQVRGARQCFKHVGRGCRIQHPRAKTVPNHHCSQRARPLAGVRGLPPTTCMGCRKIPVIPERLDSCEEIAHAALGHMVGGIFPSPERGVFQKGNVDGFPIPSNVDSHHLALTPRSAGLILQELAKQQKVGIFTACAMFPSVDVDEQAHVHILLQSMRDVADRAVCLLFRVRGCGQVPVACIRVRLALVVKFNEVQGVSRRGATLRAHLLCINARRKG